MNQTGNDRDTGGKAEPWLWANRRLLALGLILPVLLLGAGVLLVVVAESPWRWVGVGVVVLGMLVGISLVAQLRVPRVGYQNGHLLLFLRTAQPTRVPIEVVECFFLGQAPSMVKAPVGGETKTASVVVRLAEAAKQWHDRDVNEQLGRWCDGYITIRGTFCQPLTPDLLMRMNQRLSEKHRLRRECKPEMT